MISILLLISGPSGLWGPLGIVTWPITGLPIKVVRQGWPSIHSLRVFWFRLLRRRGSSGILSKQVSRIVNLPANLIRCLVRAKLAHPSGPSGPSGRRDSSQVREANQLETKPTAEGDIEPKLRLIYRADFVCLGRHSNGATLFSFCTQTGPNKGCRCRCRQSETTTTTVQTPPGCCVASTCRQPSWP